MGYWSHTRKLYPSRNPYVKIVLLPKQNIKKYIIINHLFYQTTTEKTVTYRIIVPTAQTAYEEFVARL